MDRLYFQSTPCSLDISVHLPSETDANGKVRVTVVTPNRLPESRDLLQHHTSLCVSLGCRTFDTNGVRDLLQAWRCAEAIGAQLGWWTFSISFSGTIGTASRNSVAYGFEAHGLLVAYRSSKAPSCAVRWVSRRTRSGEPRQEKPFVLTRVLVRSAAFLPPQLFLGFRFLLVWAT